MDDCGIGREDNPSPVPWIYTCLDSLWREDHDGDEVRIL